jgi:hypothetical protein
MQSSLNTVRASEGNVFLFRPYISEIEGSIDTAAKDGPMRISHCLPGAFLFTVLYLQPASAQTGPFCGGPVVDKCIVSVTTTNPPTPVNISALLQFSSGKFTLMMRNTTNADPSQLSPDLSTSSTVTVVFKASSDPGAVDPKIAVTTGLISSWSVNTAVSPHEVTFVASPRATSWSSAGCTLLSCANVATTDYQALLLAAFDPLTALPSSSFKTKIQGGFTATNGQYFDPFPNYNVATKAINIHVGAPHFKVGGVVLNTGFVRMFVPDAVITDLWGIAGGSASLVSDPALANVTVGGSAVSFTIEQLTSGGVSGAVFKVGEVTPFGYSVPDIVVTPVTPVSAAPAATPRTPPFAAYVTAYAETPQSTAVNTPFAAPLQVLVRDQYGAPFPNAPVTFVAPSTGAGLSTVTANATTGGNGIASMNATANTLAGSYQVTTSSGYLTGPIFNLTNDAGPAAAITAASGTPQTAKVDSMFNSPLQARVRDAFGNAVPRVTVTFTAAGTSKAVALFPGGNTAVTDASGQASVTARANLSAGTYTITASSGTAAPASFSLTNEQPALFVPALASGPADQLSIAWTNPLPTAITLTLSARGYDGQLIAGPGIQNPAQLTIPSGGQAARPASEIFGAAIVGRSGWLEIAPSDPTGGGGFFMLCDNALRACDGGPLVSAPAARLLFPQVNNETILHVVNTGSQPIQSASLLGYDNNGNRVGSALLAIAAQGGWSGRIVDLLPSMAGVDGYAEIDSRGLFSSSASLVGTASYQRGGDNAVVAVLDGTVRLRTGYAVHIVSGGGYTSRLKLVNTDFVQQSVQVTLNGVNAERTIPAHGRLDEPLDEMFSFSGASVVTGYLAVQTLTNTSGVIGTVEIAAAGGQLLTVEPVEGQDTVELTFPSILQDRGYWTGLALLNARQTAATVTIEIHSPAGTTVATKAVTIAPGQRAGGTVSEWFPGISNQTGGSIRITSTSPIYGVQFFGTTGENGGNFLVTVPPVE